MIIHKEDLSKYIIVFNNRKKEDEMNHNTEQIQKKKAR